MAEEIPLENFRTGIRFAVKELKPKITTDLSGLTKAEYDYLRTRCPLQRRVKGFFGSSLFDNYENQSLELMQLIVNFDLSSSGRMRTVYIQGREFSYEYFSGEPFLKRIPRDVSKGLNIKWGIRNQKKDKDKKDIVSEDPYFYTQLKDSGLYSIKQSLVNVYSSTLFLVEFLRLYKASQRMRQKK